MLTVGELQQANDIINRMLAKCDKVQQDLDDQAEALNELRQSILEYTEFLADCVRKSREITQRGLFGAVDDTNERVFDHE